MKRKSVGLGLLLVVGVGAGLWWMFPSISKQVQPPVRQVPVSASTTINRTEMQLNTLKPTEAKEVIRQLSQTEGVVTVNVDTKRKRAVVDYDKKKVSKSKITEKVKKMGLKPQDPTGNELRVIDYNIQYN